MQDSPNCCCTAFRYLCLTRAGRLRALGSYLIHPENERLIHGGGPTDVRKAVGEEIAQRGEAVNNLSNDVPKFVTQARASFLLGIPETELRRISGESGFGQLERAGEEEEIYFTYEELRQIYQLTFPVHGNH